MTERTRRPWLNYLLGLACVGAIVAAFLVVGPASGSQSTVTRTATAAQGVVQSTVSGSGNLQAASQLDLGFKTSGTVTNIYVTQGQHVTPGQLLATLNPESAEVTLEQSKAALQSAEATLAKEEETDGETSAGGTGGTGNSGAGGASASAAAVGSAPDASNPGTATAADAAPTHTTPSAQPTTPGTLPTSTAPATTTAATTPTSTPARTPTSKSPSKKTTTAAPTTTTTTGEHTTSGSERETKETKSSSSSSSSNISPATREANLASARAAVKSDRLTVQSDEEAVQNTKLYAPEDGTIVSLSGQVGETVSGGGTTKASSGSSSSGGSGTGTAAAGGVSAAGGAGSSSSSSKSSSSSSSSGSSFAILSDLSSMQLVVPLSESEIGSVKAGQPATVTVEALNGAKLAAHVSEVALLSTSSSGGAVSYDVTFQLDQLEAGLKVGMSATAEVVVKQAEGVNVPTSAISAGSVTVKRNGKEVRQRVVTGLAGNTSTIILSGLKAGETVILPATSTTGSSATNLLSKLGGRAGGGGLGGGGGGFAGGGGGA
ncbi:MAG TPA: biotin/lipoyl-binding protein, partial [Solirubrobacterales bacterium]